MSLLPDARGLRNTVFNVDFSDDDGLLTGIVLLLRFTVVMTVADDVEAEGRESLCWDFAPFSDKLSVESRLTLLAERQISASELSEMISDKDELR